MQSVLTKGVLKKGGGAYVLDIDRVYNSMAPATGYIYPKAARLEPVTVFRD
jgi:hypothetical protein